MNILILSWRDPANPLSGGAESFLHELAKRLVDHGHPVTLMTSSFPGAKKEEVKDGVRIRRAGSRWTVHLMAYLWYRKLPAGSFDLVIDNFHALPFFTPLYVKAPILGVIHEVTRKIWFAETFFPASLVGFLLEPLFFLPYRKCHFLVASDSTKEDLVRLGHPQAQITVFFQGIDFRPPPSPPRKAPDPLLVCLSRLSPSKRFEHAILAMKEVRKVFPTCKLTIAGSGQPAYLGKLRRLVSHHHLQDHVRFAGFVEGKRKRDLLKQSWIILGTSIREGWGLAITEAAAFATPAVAYDIPGFRDSVNPGVTGILVGSQRPKALAEAVVTLLRNPTLRHRLARNAMQSAYGRTRGRTFDQLLPLLETLGRSQGGMRKTHHLRLLITSWRDIRSPAAGGAEILTHEIAKRLVRRGHQVTILAPIFPGAANIETVDGVRILRPSFFFAERPIAYLNWPRFLVNAAATYRSQLASQVDCVIDQVHGLPSMTPLFARKPIILFPLEVASEIWLIEIPFPGNLLGWLIERAYLVLFRNFPFLTISPSTAGDLKRFGVRQVTTMTPGTNPPPRHLPGKARHPTFIALGRVTRMKRLEETILAFERLHNSYPQSRLVVVGRGSYLPSLRQLTNERGLAASVTFTGFLSEREKYILLSRSWALVSTSIREGWGLNVIEAASVGTPTIAYAVPGIVDAVINGRTGILARENTPESLAAAMEKFVRNTDLRTTLSRNAKRYSQQFSWEQTTSQFLSAIQKLVNNETT